MTTFRVLDAAQPQERQAWLDLLASWPGREVMAHPDYVSLFARPGDRVVCAAMPTGDGAVLLPLILRPLSAEPWAQGSPYWDAVTSYGYGGPYAWGEGRDDAGFWKAFSAWCAESKTTSTFVRLSLFPDQRPALPEPPTWNATNIVIPLTGGVDAVWAAYDGNVRTGTRFAEKAGVTFEADHEGKRLDAFFEAYTITMKRRSAAGWYFFPREFFQTIVDKLRGQFVFFHALHQGRVVSSDLVLHSPDYAYYFLAGTLDDGYALRPTYPLKHEAVKWAVAAGKKGFVLGGGYTANDGIFKFKKDFAPKTGSVPYEVATLVHDAKACNALQAARAAYEKAAGKDWGPRAGYFPTYRA